MGRVWLIGGGYGMTPATTGNNVIQLIESGQSDGQKMIILRNQFEFDVEGDDR